MLARTRISRLQRDLLAVLETESQLSYESLAARLDTDRRNIIIAVRGLELRGRLSVERGRGPVPNRYSLL